MALQNKKERIDLPDPRVFFAAERTLLAWVRTGLTIMALGFVIARFGLFLLLLHAQTQADPASIAPLRNWSSSLLGSVLTFAGSVIILGAFYNHHRYIGQFSSADIPFRAFPWLASFLSLSVAGVGILLALYLLFE